MGSRLATGLKNPLTDPNRRASERHMRGGRQRRKTKLEKSQRDLKKIRKHFACEKEGVKYYQQKFQEENKAKDDLLKQRSKSETHLRKENKSFREQLKDQRSKSDNLKKEVHRLRIAWKEMPGLRWVL